MSWSGAQRPARTAQMAWQRVEAELVLMNIEGKELMGVNEVGARIWDLADGTRSVDQIVATVVAEFAIDAATAETDVRLYLDELLAAGAISG